MKLSRLLLRGERFASRVAPTWAGAAGLFIWMCVRSKISSAIAHPLCPCQLILKMRLFVFIVSLACTLATTRAVDCFSADGQLAKGAKPCNPTAAHSHCCRDADVCLTNGLCFSSGLGAVVRRSCTDRSWNSTACPRVCTAGKLGRYPLNGLCSLAVKNASKVDTEY